MAWLDVLDHVLRPARPDLTRCAAQADEHTRARRPTTEARARAVADCVARIEAARSAVFDAKNGVVTARMTELEAEWRRLSRRADRDGDAMDLWARIAPRAWHDEKKWRIGDADRYAEAAVALAGDVAGVDAAEAALDALRRVLPVPLQTRWCFDDETDFDVRPLLAEPLRRARERVSLRDGGAFAIERAERVEARVYEAARGRLRDALARGIAHAAFADAVWSFAMGAEHNPATPLRALWTTGYTIAWMDRRAVTLAIPRLSGGSSLLEAVEAYGAVAAR